MEKNRKQAKERQNGVAGKVIPMLGILWVMLASLWFAVSCLLSLLSIFVKVEITYGKLEDRD